MVKTFRDFPRTVDYDRLDFCSCFCRCWGLHAGFLGQNVLVSVIWCQCAKVWGPVAAAREKMIKMMARVAFLAHVVFLLSIVVQRNQQLSITWKDLKASY